MAISPLFEQEDSIRIIRSLLDSSKSVKELNENLIRDKTISISTATLYRRVKELYLAGYLEKVDNGSYSVSELGKIAINELFNQHEHLDESQNNLSLLISQLTGKESSILQKLQQRPSYTSGLLQEIAISPNELLKIFDNLIRLQLIEIIEKPGKKPGRPKKIYRLTDSGKLIIKEIEIIKEKLQRTRRHV